MAFIYAATPEFTLSSPKGSHTRVQYNQAERRQSSVIPEGRNRLHFLTASKLLLPTIGVVTFLAMMAAAEYQVRSSPQWPPPTRHEVGGWQIDDPPLWTLAASLNLPATLPIILMAATSDGFTYALDDHHLIVYIPWAFLVFCLWYFVACQIGLYRATYSMGSTFRGLSTFVILAFITAELIYCGMGILNRPPINHPQETPTVVLVCFWTWILAMVLGWVNLIQAVSRRQQAAS